MKNDAQALMNQQAELAEAALYAQEWINTATSILEKTDFIILEVPLFGEYNENVPRFEVMTIPQEFIGAIIGPQGKIIQEIQRETGTTINIEEVGNQGEVSVFSPAKEGLDRAVAWIKGIVAMPEVGEEYESKVKSIMPYGAFVEFMPGKQGLLHISEVSWKRLENLDGILKEGDMVKVKLVGIDHKTGKFKLSRKALIPKPDFKQEDGNNSSQD
jgi:polyribonucleotide nucleotidyltransferase